MIFRIILLIISYLLLAAHFLREGEMILTIACLFIPFLLFIKKRWSLTVVQIFTYGGVLVWIQTLFLLVNARLNMGESWMRMAIILGVIILLTLTSGLLLNSNQFKKNYH